MEAVSSERMRARLNDWLGANCASTPWWMTKYTTGRANRFNCMREIPFAGEWTANIRQRSNIPRCVTIKEFGSDMKMLRTTWNDFNDFSPNV